MSKRTIDGLGTQLKMEIESWNRCKHLYDEVCCEHLCDCCGDFPDTQEYCTKCEYFEKEDGVLPGEV